MAGVRGNRRLVERYYDNNNWQISKQQGTTIYLQCALKKRCGCPARGILQNGIFKRSLKFPYHRHTERPNAAFDEAFRGALREAVENQWRSFRVIYDDIREQFPDEARRLNFDEIAPTLRVWRNSRELPTVDQFEDIQLKFESPTWHELLQHDNGVMFMNCITVAGQQAAVIGCPNFSTTIGEINFLDISVHQIVKPTVGNTQGVLSVTAIWQERALSFSWVLFNNLTPELSHGIMETVKERLMPNVNPPLIHTSCDPKLFAGISRVWEDAEIHFTFHHFTLAVLNRAYYDENIDLNDENHVKIVKKMVLICLLPPAAIPQSVEYIKRSLEAMGGDIREHFSPILLWFAQMFIHTFRPQDYSCYNKPRLLTDVSRSISNKSLNDNRDNHEPGFWPFYGTLVHTLTSSWNNARTLRENDERLIANITTSPRARPCISTPLIRRLWTMFQRRMIGIDRFLSLAASVITEYFNDVLHVREFTLGEFFPTPAANLRVNDNFEYRGPAANGMELLLEMNLDEQRLGVMVEVEVLEDEGDIDNAAEGRNAAVAENVADPVDEPFSWKCLNCREQKFEMVVKPCNCVCICAVCAQNQRDASRQDMRNLQCPKCHRVATNFERVYLSATGIPESPYDWICQVCLINDISHMGQHCKHLQVCSDCVVYLPLPEPPQGAAKLCPVCRAVNVMIEVHLPAVNE